MSVEMTYVGSTGNVNYDVAVETGEGAHMERGKKYRVSEELAAQLFLTHDWKAPASREKELEKLSAEGAGERPVDPQAEQAGTPDHAIQTGGDDNTGDTVDTEGNGGEETGDSAGSDTENDKESDS